MTIRRLLQEIEYRRLRRQLTEAQLGEVIHHARQVNIPRRQTTAAQIMAALATVHTIATTGIITWGHPVQVAGLPLTIFTWGASLYTMLAVAHRMINLTRPRWHWVR